MFKDMQADAIIGTLVERFHQRRGVGTLGYNQETREATDNGLGFSLLLEGRYSVGTTTYTASTMIHFLITHSVSVWVALERDRSDWNMNVCEVKPEDWFLQVSHDSAWHVGIQSTIYMARENLVNRLAEQAGWFSRNMHAMPELKVRNFTGQMVEFVTVTTARSDEDGENGFTVIKKVEPREEAPQAAA